MSELSMLIGGIFCLCIAVFNWDFFFDTPQVELFIRLFGRNGGRLFYALIGVVLIFIAR